jgi:hypothetical protein
VTELQLFISHASSDGDTAKALVELFEKALKLPARAIRCTSVDGYRLPVGADTDEQLRREIFVAKAFVGLLTPRSVTSAYVLFELGARWGAKRHLAPVLARGADAQLLAGPLSSLNTLRLSRREEVLQLVEDISEYLELPLEPLASFQGAVDAVVAVSNRPPSPATAPTVAAHDATAKQQPTVTEDEVKLLSFLVERRQSAADIAAHLNVSSEKARYYIDRLRGFKMINFAPNANRQLTYHLEQPGREFLVQKGLL